MNQALNRPPKCHSCGHWTTIMACSECGHPVCTSCSKEEKIEAKDQSTAMMDIALEEDCRWAKIYCPECLSKREGGKH